MHTRHAHTRTLLLTAALLQAAACSEKSQTVTAPTAPEEQGAPKIAALEQIHDFGEAKQGKEVSHVFKIKNVGAKELVIEKTHGS